MKNLINNQKVFIKELHTSKGREKHRSFLIEGEKVIFEAISTRHPITYIVATEELRDVALELATKASCELFITSASIMNSISTMSTPPGILAVASVLETPSQQPCPHTLLLEGISDPGNLGTLLRSAEW
ncbi:hypothetical protein IT409_01895, partial [Candidatus Falkowbacteria bacterium]|nr:hypothetical protein [Candidatus Falkowbacteria bacterium]